MPNFVTRPQTTKMVESPEIGQLLPSAPKEMNVVDKFFHNRNVSKSAKEIREFELRVSAEEAKKTIDQHVRAQGAILRAEGARVQAEVLGTVVLELTNVHKTVVQAQGDSRMAGTLSNFEALKSHMDATRQRLSSGALNQQEAEICAMTAQAIHAENESRMDQFHQMALNATDALTAAALAPITSRR